VKTVSNKVVRHSLA